MAGASKSGDQIIDEARAKAEAAAAQAQYDIDVEMRYRDIQLIRWQMFLTATVGAAAGIAAIVVWTRSKRR